MEYGFVCFAYSKNEWIAKAIAWFTKSKWSHSFITVPTMLDREMVMEAAEGGVEMTPFDISYRNNTNQIYEVYRFKVAKEVIDKAVLKCMDELEFTYGFLQYPWFIWRAINRVFGRDIKKQNNWSQHGVICSELVRSFLTNAGYGNLFDGFGQASNNAQDTYDLVLAHPELFELIEAKT